MQNYSFDNTDFTWYAPTVLALSKIPSSAYGSDNRYQDKVLISNSRGQRIQLIQKRWFPTTSDSDTLIYVDIKYQYRPDVISIDYYNTPLFAWAILAANDIRSIWQLEAGQFIKIPALSQILKGLNT